MKPSPRRVRITPEVRAYMAKIDRYRAGDDPLRIMRAAPARLARAVRGLTRAQLTRRPSRGKWSVAEILGHLLDTEVVYGYRCRMALGQPGMPIQAYDQAQWSDVFRGKRASVPRLLQQIRQLRAVNLDLVSGVPRTWWSRYGHHSERGKESVRRTLELVAGHDRNHLDQIMAIRKLFKTSVRATGRRAARGTAKTRPGRRPRARRRAAA